MVNKMRKEIGEEKRSEFWKYLLAPGKVSPAARVHSWLSPGLFAHVSNRNNTTNPVKTGAELMG